MSENPTLLSRTIIDPHVCHGKPAIQGLRYQDLQAYIQFAAQCPIELTLPSEKSYQST